MGAGKKRGQPAKTSSKKPTAATPAKPKNKGGRPSKFGTVDLKSVEKLALRGWTDEEMADFFKVDRVTRYRWKKEHGEFRNALKDWKVEADARVERALYERACGYSHPEIKHATFEGEFTDEVEVTKHYPPDTAAAFIWLKNRQGWSDKVTNEHVGPDGEALNITVNFTGKKVGK